MNLPFYGVFTEAPTLAGVLGVLVVLSVLGFTGAPLLVWTFAGAVGLYGFGAPASLWVVYGVLALVFNLLPLRRVLSLAARGESPRTRKKGTASRFSRRSIVGNNGVPRARISGSPPFSPEHSSATGC